MSITICLRKRRIGKSNRLRWRCNKHKKPFYLVSELNKMGRIDYMYKVLYNKHFKMFYQFKKRSWKND